MILTHRPGFEILINDDDAVREIVVDVAGESVSLIPKNVNWEIKRHGYTHYASIQIMRRCVRRRFMLHRLLTSSPEGMVVDHKNRNGLDCRRENLRICSPSQNQANKIANHNRRFKGVRLTESGKVVAAIGINGSSIHLGIHATIEAAARAYDSAAIKLFGEFASLNFPQEAETII